MPEPLVSVIIPAFNHADYLPRALDSVLAQDGLAIEVIVVDDGSTDGTREILASYGDAIRPIFQANSGVSTARNRGLEAARGQYVCFLDADDLMLPGKLARQVGIFRSDPALSFVNSGWRIIDKHGETLREIAPWNFAPKLDLPTLLLWKPVFPGALMFRRDDLARIGGFDPALAHAEDVDLVLRLSAAGARAAWLKETTVCYRLHGENAVQDGLSQAQGIERVLTRVFSLEHLPRAGRRIEGRVWLSTYTWIVWHLYNTGFAQHTEEYLRKSIPYSHYYPPTDFTVIDWLIRLSSHARTSRVPIEELRGMKEHLLAVVDLPPGDHRLTALALDMWLDIWAHYTYGQPERARAGLEAYRDVPLDDFLEATVPLVFLNYQITAREVRRFWDDALSLSIVAPAASPELTRLYLSVLAAAIPGRRFRTALSAGLSALQTGLNPRTIPIWLWFVSHSLTHLRKLFVRHVLRHNRQHHQVDQAS